MIRPDDPDKSHGTRSGYRRGCRCDDCRGWNAARSRAAYRRRRARAKAAVIPGGTACGRPPADLLTG